MRTTTYDGLGRPISFTKQLGRGAEGSIFAVSHDNNVVAKVYHKQLKVDDVEKLRVMTSLGTPDSVESRCMALYNNPGSPVGNATRFSYAVADGRKYTS